MTTINPFICCDYVRWDPFCFECGAKNATIQETESFLHQVLHIPLFEFSGTPPPCRVGLLPSIFRCMLVHITEPEEIDLVFALFWALKKLPIYSDDLKYLMSFDHEHPGLPCFNISYTRCMRRVGKIVGKVAAQGGNGRRLVHPFSKDEAFSRFLDAATLKWHTDYDDTNNENFPAFQ